MLLKKINCLLNLVFSFSSSADTTVRKRNVAATPFLQGDQADGHMVGQDLTSEVSTKSQEQEEQQQETSKQKSAKTAEQPEGNSPAAAAWSPLVANVCLCTALALSAYVCYRVYFHWCLSSTFWFPPVSVSTNAAKWTPPARPPALLCATAEDLDSDRSRNSLSHSTHAL